MKQVELVVFDIAGTTVKDSGEVGMAFQKAMDAFGYQVPLTDINPLMGYKKPEAIRMMLGQYEPDSHKITAGLIHEIHGCFEKNMLSYYLSDVPLEPLPNVEKVFSVLRENNIKTGLDTGFSKQIAGAIIEKLRWLKNGTIDCVVASDEVPAGRPEPYMIQKIMEQTGVQKVSHTVKIGDTEVDINEGKNAGCLYSIGITSGAFTKEELEPYAPSHIINDMIELLEILELKH